MARCQGTPIFMYRAKTIAHPFAFPQFGLQLFGPRCKLWDTRVADHLLTAIRFSIVYELRIKTLTTLFFVTVLARVRLDVVGGVACLSTFFAHQSCWLFPLVSAFIVVSFLFWPGSSGEGHFACSAPEFRLAFLTDQLGCFSLFEIVEILRVVL